MANGPKIDLTDLSAPHGFNINPDVKLKVGHLNKIKIGDTQLKTDLEVPDPEDTSKMKKVVGVLTSIVWTGDRSEPIFFEGYTSASNRIEIKKLLWEKMPKINCKLDWVAYEYDTIADPPKYFKCFYSDKELETTVVKDASGEALLSIEESPSAVVSTPEVYGFTFYVTSESKKQEIKVDLSSTAKTVQEWGITSK